MHYDTVIIGAGMSGLAAGCRLAHYEQKVCVLERHTTIGGLNSFYRLNGRNHDVGLHAVTNFTPRGARKGALARLLRQLRIRWDEFELVPQNGSAILFPGRTLRFNNDFEQLESEVAREFPDQIDNFRKLNAAVVSYDDLDYTQPPSSAREFVASHITDPVLVEMIMCPLMFYGCAREHDMDLVQFSIMYQSIFREGLSRPWAGVRVMLKTLVRRYKERGGELRLRAGVQKLDVDNGRVSKIVLDSGEELTADCVISSAGWVETMRMCGQAPPEERMPGQFSFFETASILDKQPGEIGFDWTTAFFSREDKFHWHNPDRLVDVRSGVICSPNNFAYDKPVEEGQIRITVLADYGRWNALDKESYYAAKRQCYDEVIESAAHYIPDYRPSVIATDTFSPTTIRHFTGHDGGTVYGAPRKQYDGCTHLENLFVCGTDQGFVGIIGAMASGLSMANAHCIR